MRYFLRIFSAILLFLSVSGCKEEAQDYRSFVAKPVLDTADIFLERVRAGDEAKASDMLIQELQNDNGKALVKKAIEAFKTSPVTSNPPYQVVLYNIAGEIYGSHHEVTYQMQREQGWLLVHVGVDDVYKKFFGVTNIEFRYIPMPLQELNALSLKGKPWKHYAIMAICAAILGLVVYSFILLLRTKTRKRWIWWIWLFLIGVGFVRFSFNWTSGGILLYPTDGVGPQVLYHLGWVVNLQHNSHFEPWYVQFMIPVGALLFLWRRKALMQRAEEEQPESTQEEA